MKTYATLCAFFALLILSCSKSDNNPIDEGGSTSVDADYVAVLRTNGLIKPRLLNANAETISLNSDASSLTEKPIPDLSFVDGSYFLQYHKDGACGGQITQHDFKSDSTIDTAVFTDLNACELSATAIARSNGLLFVSYVVTSDDPDAYFVRIIDLSASDTTIDVPLNEKPVDLAVANNRLFVLTFDELITDENSLTVIDLSTNAAIHEMDLGYSVRHIFADIQKNIIISYDELHTTLNSVNFSFEYTQYEGGTAPNFSGAVSLRIDEGGRLFYPMDPGLNSSYPRVPAIYDFSQSLVTLYAYENFLTEAKRNFEYEIETTTAVHYDQKNGLLLVGYEKMNTASKEGGLLRIKLEPEPAFIDNIDLEGVPVELFVN